jgi:dCTP deaminase
MILTGPEILRQRAEGRIAIEPFDPRQINPNSYNLRLADTLKVYLPRGETELNAWIPHTRFPAARLDCRSDNPVWAFQIPEGGITLYPGKLYLGATVERTASDHFVPMLEGRSSLARLGISVHQTGGFGDMGFAGNWTLEITCVEPVVIYAGMEVCQVQFWTAQGAQMLYGRLKHKPSKYYEQVEPTPSKLFTETGDTDERDRADGPEDRSPSD